VLYNTDKIFLKIQNNVMIFAAVI